MTALALPLWIRGRAYLTAVREFIDVSDSQGRVLRRTPLCGEDEVVEAMAAAAQARPAWELVGSAARQGLLLALGEALAGYREHFAQLLSEETGAPLTDARQEIDEAVRLLQGTPATAGDGLSAAGVWALCNDRSQGFVALIAALAALLLAGRTVVIKPSPYAPSSLFALAELTARVGIADGVVNVVQGDEAAVKALLAHPELSALGFAGEDGLADKIAGLAEAAGKAFYRLRREVQDA